MTNTTDLPPAMYLVGQDDGGMEPFFCRITDERKYEYHVSHDIIRRAVRDPDWWWQQMVPDYLPLTWKGWPNDIKEPGADG